MADYEKYKKKKHLSESNILKKIENEIKNKDKKVQYISN